MSITLVCWNFENNGKGNASRRAAGDDVIRSLNPDIVFRQELWQAGDNGRRIFHEQAHTLGLHGVLGARSCTALFYNASVFSVVREWEQVFGPHYVLTPTAVLLRYKAAGPDALPFNAVSFHLAYGSSAQRLLEAEWLTTWADKRWTTPDGRIHTLPAILAGDTNSYPVPGTPGELPLPNVARIKNAPHRLHRSYPGPHGERVPDTRPDTALLTAGLVDAARHWATAPHGDPSALARTVDRCDTHGPDARIDRAYLSPGLLAAVSGADVIEVDPDLSDHHILRLTLDDDLLGEALAAQTDGTMK
ncbi:endonuclease/exonuclease/phosphatase family protein [Streptomyces sp. NPDC001478]